MKLHRHDAGSAPSGDALIRWAGRYDLVMRLWWRRGDRWRRGLLDRLDLRPGQRVLDIGSGTGHLAFAMADRVAPGGSVDGVDAAAEMVRRAERNNRRRRRPVTFTTAYAQQLPFPEASFDAVACTLALHHVAADDRRAAVAEMRRVLRPGGRLLIADFQPNPGRRSPVRHLFGGHPDHAHALDEAAALLAAAGFADLTRGPTTVRRIGYVLAVA